MLTYAQPSSFTLLLAVPVLPITPADFASALKRVGPSIVRGAEADIKPVL